MDLGTDQIDPLTSPTAPENDSGASGRQAFARAEAEARQVGAQSVADAGVKAVSTKPLPPPDDTYAPANAQQYASPFSGALYTTLGTILNAIPDGNDTNNARISAINKAQASQAIASLFDQDPSDVLDNFDAWAGKITGDQVSSEDTLTKVWHTLGSWWKEGSDSVNQGNAINPFRVKASLGTLTPEDVDAQLKIADQSSQVDPGSLRAKGLGNIFLEGVGNLLKDPWQSLNLSKMLIDLPKNVLDAINDKDFGSKLLELPHMVISGIPSLVDSVTGRGGGIPEIGANFARLATVEGLKQAIIKNPMKSPWTLPAGIVLQATVGGMGAHMALGMAEQSGDQAYLQMLTDPQYEDKFRTKEGMEIAGRASHVFETVALALNAVPIGKIYEGALKKAVDESVASMIVSKSLMTRVAESIGNASKAGATMATFSLATQIAQDTTLQVTARFAGALKDKDISVDDIKTEIAKLIDAVPSALVTGALLHGGSSAIVKTAQSLGIVPKAITPIEEANIVNNIKVTDALKKESVQPENPETRTLYVNQPIDKNGVVVPRSEAGVMASSDINHPDIRQNLTNDPESVIRQLSEKYPDEVVAQLLNDSKKGEVNPLAPTSRAVQDFEESSGLDYSQLRKLVPFLKDGQDVPVNILDELGLSSNLHSSEIHQIQLDPTTNVHVSTRAEADSLVANGLPEGKKSVSWDEGDHVNARIMDKGGVVKTAETAVKAPSKAKSVNLGEPIKNYADLARHLAKASGVSEEHTSAIARLTKSFFDSIGADHKESLSRLTINESNLKGVVDNGDGTKSDARGARNIRSVDGKRLSDILFDKDNANPTTVAHELFHYGIDVLAQLDHPYLKLAEDFMGKKYKDWTVYDHEKLTNLHDEYLRNGEAPPKSGLAKLFAKISEWFKNIPRDFEKMQLSPGAKIFFDMIYGKNENGKTTGSTLETKETETQFQRKRTNEIEQMKKDVEERLSKKEFVSNDELQVASDNGSFEAKAELLYREKADTVLDLARRYSYYTAFRDDALKRQMSLEDIQNAWAEKDAPDTTSEESFRKSMRKPENVQDFLNRVEGYNGWSKTFHTDDELKAIGRKIVNPANIERNRIEYAKAKYSQLDSNENVSRRVLGNSINEYYTGQRMITDPMINDETGNFIGSEHLDSKTREMATLGTLSLSALDKSIFEANRDNISQSAIDAQNQVRDKVSKYLRWIAQKPRALDAFYSDKAPIGFLSDFANFDRETGLSKDERRKAYQELSDRFARNNSMQSEVGKYLPTILGAIDKTPSDMTIKELKAVDKVKTYLEKEARDKVLNFRTHNIDIPAETFAEQVRDGLLKIADIKGDLKAKAFLAEQIKSRDGLAIELSAKYGMDPEFIHSLIDDKLDNIQNSEVVKSVLDRLPEESPIRLTKDQIKEMRELNSMVNEGKASAERHTTASSKEVDKNVVYKTLRAYARAGFDPVRIIDMMDGSFYGIVDRNGPLYRMINEAYGEKVERPVFSDLQKTVVDFGNKLKELGLKKGDFSKKMVGESGKERTVQEVLGLYAFMQNKEASQHVIFGNGISRSESKSLIDQLTPEMKSIGDWIIEKYGARYDQMHDAMVAVGESPADKVEGVYTQIHAKDILHANPVGVDTPIKVGQDISSMKNRSLQSHTALDLDILKNFFHDEENKLLVIHGSVPFKIMDKVLFENGNQSISDGITHFFGNGSMQYLRDTVNENKVAGIYNNNGDVERWWSKMNNNIVVATLAFKTMNAMLQHTQALQGIDFFDSRIEGTTRIMANMLKIDALGVAGRAGVWLNENVYSKSSFMRFRSDSILRDMNNSFKGGISGKYQTFKKAGMWLYAEVDSLASGAVWRAKYEELKSKGVPENVSVNIADEVVKLTQPTGTKMSEAQMLRSGNGLMKLLTAFTTGVNKLGANMWFDGPKNIARIINSTKIGSKDTMVTKSGQTVKTRSYVQKQALKSIITSIALNGSIALLYYMGKNAGLPQIKKNKDGTETNEWADVAIDALTSGIPLWGNIIATGASALSTMLGFEGKRSYTSRIAPPIVNTFTDLGTYATRSAHSNYIADQQHSEIKAQASRQASSNAGGRALSDATTILGVPTMFTSYLPKAWDAVQAQNRWQALFDLAGGNPSAIPVQTGQK